MRSWVPCNHGGWRTTWCIRCGRDAGSAGNDGGTCTQAATGGVSASAAGGANASAKACASACFNAELTRWSEQLEAMGHWLEDDLSAKEIEKLKLIKAMGVEELL